MIRVTDSNFFFDKEYIYDKTTFSGSAIKTIESSVNLTRHYTTVYTITI